MVRYVQYLISLLLLKVNGKSYFGILCLVIFFWFFLFLYNVMLVIVIEQCRSVDRSLYLYQYIMIFSFFRDISFAQIFLDILKRFFNIFVIILVILVFFLDEMVIFIIIFRLIFVIRFLFLVVRILFSNLVEVFIKLLDCDVQFFIMILSVFLFFRMLYKLQVRLRLKFGMV